jgi:uncharacterized protein YdaU (DUF1376 family)
MKIAAFSIADYCEATEGMPHDVERLYFRMIMKMFSREAGLPDDDRESARIFGYDVRTYRRLKVMLMAWPNAIYIEAGEIKNARVENELAEIVERKKAAAENGRLGGKSRRLRADFAPTSPELRRNFDQKSDKITNTVANKNNNLAEASPSPSPSPKEVEKRASVEVARPASKDSMIRLTHKFIGLPLPKPLSEDRAGKIITGVVDDFGEQIVDTAIGRLKSRLLDGAEIRSPVRILQLICEDVRKDQQPRKSVWADTSHGLSRF